MKVAGGRLYVYYGLLPVLAKERGEIGELIGRAMDILSGKMGNLLNKNIQLSNFPFNIVSIDVRKKHVTFSWYRNFWSDIRPSLLYSISVHVPEGKVRARIYKGRDSTWPWNYLHRKELLVEGLEEVVLDPYGNGLSLAWDPKMREDRWIPLPWECFKVRTRVRGGVVRVVLDKRFEGREVEVIVKIAR